MEKAPFKLNEELVEVMGGRDSAYFSDYRQLCIDAMIAARKNSDELVTMMEIMFFQSNYPAFRYSGYEILDYQIRLHTSYRYNKNAIRDFVSRFHLDKRDDEVPALVDGLINK
jgi:phosphatidylinositol kinase/protein kinase (PI-3  family)